MIKRLVHVGVAVKDAAATARLYRELFGFEPAHSEDVPDQKVRTVFFETGGGGVELLQPLAPDSPVARFLERRGEGVHHISFEVDSVEDEIERLKRAGFEMIDEKPRPGAHGYRIAFLHPRSTNGVLIEIGERGK